MSHKDECVSPTCRHVNVPEGVLPLKHAPEKAPDAAEVAARQIVEQFRQTGTVLWCETHSPLTRYWLECEECIAEALRAYARDEFKKLAEQIRALAAGAQSPAYVMGVTRAAEIADRAAGKEGA